MWTARGDWGVTRSRLMTSVLLYLFESLERRAFARRPGMQSIICRLREHDGITEKPSYVV